MLLTIMPYFHSAGNDLYYRSAGKGNVAVLLVHGWYQNGTQAWAALTKNLRTKYHVFVPDLPGHGLNPHVPHDFSTAVNEQLVIDFARYLRSHYRCKKVFLVGHSYGAFAVLSIAAKAAEEFEGVTAISAVDDYAPYHRRLKSVLRIPRLLDPIYYRMQALLGGFPYGDRMQLYGHMHEDFHPGKLAYAKKKNKTLSPANSRRYMRAFLAAKVQWPQQLQLLLPLLLIYGERDMLTPASWAKRIQPHFRVSEVHVVPAAGHNVQISATDAVAGKIRSFIEKCLRPQRRQRGG